MSDAVISGLLALGSVGWVLVARLRQRCDGLEREGRILRLCREGHKHVIGRWEKAAGCTLEEMERRAAASNEEVRR